MIEKAIALLQQQKFGLAKTVCLHLIKKHPEHYQANLIAGVCALHEQHIDQAIDCLTRASLAAQNARDKAQAYSNLSLAYQANKTIDKALIAIHQAIHWQPDNPLYYCNRANLYEAQEAWQAMAEDARKAFELDYTLLDAQISLCFALRKQQDFVSAWSVLSYIQSFNNQDWLNEWAVLHADFVSNVLSEQLDQHQITDTQLITMAAYACEQQAFKAAHALYAQAAQRQPNNAEVLHQLAALSEQHTEKAPAAYISDLFDNAAAEFDTHMIEKLDYQVPEQLATLLVPYLTSGLQVVDLGCGTGLAGLAITSHQPNLHLTGVDLSDNMLEKARERGIYQQLCRADVTTALPSLPNSDLVVMTDLLIYLGALEDLFHAINQHLRSQGFVAFSTETCDTHWRLSVTGRYQHSDAYIQALGNTQTWELVQQQPTALRTEHKQPVLGTLWVFKKV